MTLDQIVTISNNSTDENFSASIIQEYFNEGVANINTETSSRLPYITGETVGEDYNAIGEEWIRSILIPYVCYLIKFNDGSLNEAGSAFFQRYQVGLANLKKNQSRVIPPRYRIFWEESSELEFLNAVYKLEYDTGTDTPSSSFLKDPWNVKPGTVAAVYTSDLQSVAFYKVSGGSGVRPIGMVGSNNKGWFASRTVSTTSDKFGITGD